MMVLVVQWHNYKTFKYRQINKPKYLSLYSTWGTSRKFPCYANVKLHSIYTTVTILITISTVLDVSYYY